MSTLIAVGLLPVRIRLHSAISCRLNKDPRSRVLTQDQRDTRSNLFSGFAYLVLVSSAGVLLVVCRAFFGLSIWFNFIRITEMRRSVAKTGCRRVVSPFRLQSYNTDVLVATMAGYVYHNSLIGAVWDMRTEADFGDGAINNKIHVLPFPDKTNFFFL